MFGRGFGFVPAYEGGGTGTTVVCNVVVSSAILFIGRAYKDVVVVWHAKMGNVTENGIRDEGESMNEKV